MRQGITVQVSESDRVRLAAIVADRNSPQKHVWRARIVLMTGDGIGTNTIMRQTGKSKVTVWRWQERFTAQGVDGLVRDKTRPSRIPRLPATVHEQTVALTQTDPPGEVTHWTAQMMAKQVGISVSSVQRIWHSHGLQPHRVRQFKLSRDRQFVTKLRDIVGLGACPRAGRRPDPWIDPPAHAVVLSIGRFSPAMARVYQEMRWTLGDVRWRWRCSLLDFMPGYPNGCDLRSQRLSCKPLTHDFVDCSR